jgi:DNA recombination protein RmuC
VGSFEGTVIPGARKLAELGARGARELNTPQAIETATRDVLKRN